LSPLRQMLINHCLEHPQPSLMTATVSSSPLKALVISSKKLTLSHPHLESVEDPYLINRQLLKVHPFSGKIREVEDYFRALKKKAKVMISKHLH